MNWSLSSLGLVPWLIPTRLDNQNYPCPSFAASGLVHQLPQVGRRLVALARAG